MINAKLPAQRTPKSKIALIQLIFFLSKTDIKKAITNKALPLT